MKNKKQLQSASSIFRKEGLPVHFTKNIILYDVIPTEKDVVFDFTFYGSDARVQYEINECGNLEFMFSEILDGHLMESFEEFHEEEKDELRLIYDLSMQDENS